MTIDIIEQEASIVVVGAFNPTIFNPDWLLRHELISDDAMGDVNIEIIHRDVSRFSLGWLSIEVVFNRFTARTNDPSYFLPLQDLVVSLFSILNQIPVKQLGMNRTFELSLPDQETWHKLGDTLAPKDIWKKFLPERVGLMSLKVTSPRDDNLTGNLNVTIEPSKLADIQNGIHFSTNSHVELDPDDNASIKNVLFEYWESTLDQSSDMSNAIIEEATF